MAVDESKSSKDYEERNRKVLSELGIGSAMTPEKAEKLARVEEEKATWTIPVVTVPPVHAKAPGSWEAVVPDELAGVMAASLGAMGYPSEVVDYDDLAAALTDGTIEAETARLVAGGLPGWVEPFPRHVRTDAPDFLVERLLEAVYGDGDVEAWHERVHRAPSMTEDEWAVSPLNQERR